MSVSKPIITRTAASSIALGITAVNVGLTSSPVVGSCIAYAGIKAIKAINNSTATCIYSRVWEAVTKSSSEQRMNNKGLLLLSLPSLAYLSYYNTNDRIMYCMDDAGMNWRYAPLAASHMTINIMLSYTAANLIIDAYEGRIMSKIAVLATVLCPSQGVLSTMIQGMGYSSPEHVIVPAAIEAIEFLLLTVLVLYYMGQQISQALR